ncbi:MAG: response regulator [Candidatus Sedimenticola sp. 20ELBAFRAG]
MSETPLMGEILVVDDTAANLKLVSEMLSSQGYKVRPANSGELALTTISVKQPDLVLLDVRMPGMDGYEVCSRLRSGPATSDLPIIFLSALDEAEGRSKGFEVGGSDFITKPVVQDELFARVRTQLELQRLRKRVAELEAGR